MRIEIEEVPGERIIECPRDRDATTGVALVELRRSQPHRHERTVERYVLLSGAIDAHVGSVVMRRTKFGDWMIIPASVIHWAESVGDTPAILAVYSTPPWSKEDHHLVEPSDALTPISRRSILFVNAGTWGDMRSTTQDKNAELYIPMLRQSTDVEVVGTIAEAREQLRLRRFDAVVFRSRGMENAAREIKREHPAVRIVLLSGFAPLNAEQDLDLVWIAKTNIEDPAAFARAVLGR